MSIEHNFAIKDKKVVMKNDATLSVVSTSLQYAFSVYESIKVINSHPVYAVDHINRLFSSAKGISLVHPFSSEDILISIYELLKANEVKEATIRILLTGGDESHLFITSDTILSYPDSYYTDGVSVTSYMGERFLPLYKTSALLMNYLALKEARVKGCFEALLVDRYGKALEGTRSNLFALKGNTFYTAVDDEVLEGVTRDKILKAIAHHNFTISYTPIDLIEIKKGSYDSLFLSSTSMGALPISSVDSVKVKVQSEKIALIHRQIREWEIESLP